MEIKILNDRVLSTDYWDCRDGALAGRSWLSVHNNTWHLFCPKAPETVRERCRDTAVPVKADEGWCWLILVAKRLRVHVSLDAIYGTPPVLANPGTITRRSLRVYCNQSRRVQGIYGNAAGHEELSVALSCNIDVVRPVNVNGHWCLNGRVWRNGR